MATKKNETPKDKAPVESPVESQPTDTTPAETKAEPQAKIGQRKVGRGSARRVNRALDAFTDACDVLAKELDLQIFMMDEDGKRVAPWPFVEQFKEMPLHVRREVMGVMHPPVEEDEAAE